MPEPLTLDLLLEIIGGKPITDPVPPRLGESAPIGSSTRTLQSFTPDPVYPVDCVDDLDELEGQFPDVALPPDAWRHIAEQVEEELSRDGVGRPGEFSALLEGALGRAEITVAEIHAAVSGLAQRWPESRLLVESALELLGMQLLRGSDHLQWPTRPRAGKRTILPVSGTTEMWPRDHDAAARHLGFLPENLDHGTKDYLLKICQQPYIDRMKERELGARARAGDAQAAEEVMRSHLWLAAKIASRYVDQGLEVDDLIQEASTGLMEAVQRYDPGRSARFSQYAGMWVFQRVKRALANDRLLIRLPVYQWETIERILGCGNLFDCGVEEIATDLTAGDLDHQDARQLASALKVESLDKLRDEHGFDVELPELDPSEDEIQGPFGLASAVDTVLRTLAHRERRVLRLRFGLDGGSGRTLEEVGREFGVTRERIRQIEAKALVKLRHPSRSRQLKDWYPTIQPKQDKAAMAEQAGRRAKSG